MLARIYSKKPVRIKSQHRPIVSSYKLKGLYHSLTDRAKPLSPIHGVALSKTNLLEKMWTTNLSDDIFSKLVRTLFHKQESQFKPSILSPINSLSPAIEGLILGALSQNKLQETEIKNYIISQWYRESVKTNATIEKSKFEKKAHTVLILFESAYSKHRNTMQAILLNFLALKADSKKDMVDYLKNTEQFLPVFKSNVDLSAITLSQYSPMCLNDNNVTIDSILTNNDSYEQAICSFIYQKEFSSIYPPQVMHSYYSFKEQEVCSDCSEAAMRSLFNILLYDIENKCFSLSQLPSHIKPSQQFKAFYEIQNSLGTINTQQTGQAFMNLVSDIPGVSYNNSNYELKSIDSDKNLITLSNYLLGINAHNLDELGYMLSDEKRTISFTLQNNIDQSLNNPLHCIYITIKNHIHLYEQKIQFLFRLGHGWLKTSAEKEKNILLDLNRSKKLAQLYDSSLEAQILFHLQISPETDTISSILRNSVNPIMYYAFNEKDPSIAYKIIKHIVEKNANNKDATNYTDYLLKNISGEYKHEAQRLFIKSQSE
jgi:hypothetical protein